MPAPRPSRPTDDGDPRLVRRLRRVQSICQILARGALPPQALLAAVNRSRAPGDAPIRRRCLELDLSWIRRHLGPIVEAVPRARWPGEPPAGHANARRFWRLCTPDPPHPVDPGFASVTGLEIAALDAARAMLTTPGPDGQGAGPLADAIDGLIRRLGLPDLPIEERIAVRGTPRQGSDPAVLLVCLQALRAGQSLSGTYRPQHRTSHPVRIQPLRIVLVDGEPALWAWDAEDRRTKRYQLARFYDPVTHARLSDLPTDARREVARRIAADFRGQGSGVPRRVTLLVLPPALGRIEGRILGPGQRSDDLPDGSRRISFLTLGAYRRGAETDAPRSPPPILSWVLSLAPDVIIEGPADLRALQQACAADIVRQMR